MHRHGAVIFKPQQTLGGVRHAWAAAQLKPRDQESGHSQYSPSAGPSASAQSSSSAAEKLAALRRGFSKAGQSSAAVDQRSFRSPSRDPSGSRHQDRQSDWRPPKQDNARNPKPDLRSHKPYNPNSQQRDRQLAFQPRHAQNKPPHQVPNPTRHSQNTPDAGSELLASPSTLQGEGNVRRQPSEPVISIPDEDLIPQPDNEPLKYRNTRQRTDEKFKSRGSLLEQAQQSRPQHSFTRPQNMDKPKAVKTVRQSHARQVRRQVFIPSTVSMANLARILHVKPAVLKRKVERLGITDQATYDYVLTADYAALLAEEFGVDPVVDDEAAFDLFPPKAHSDPSTLPLRPPIVTIMGHVDHGKTTLLDTLRSASVAKGEAGGITQHIGAFSVPVKTSSNEGARSITFLDTPGHAAFSAMRARGAGVTDIIVLVVAADDGLMPQTKEVIELYKKNQDTVALVVAINKIDKPSADIEAAEKALMAEGIQLESYGGDIPAVHVSGLTGAGLPDLVEMLSAVAEMQDLRAEPDGFACGEVLEAKVQQGLGIVATVLVTRGCLKTGSHILGGQNYAKVRRMTDSKGQIVKSATPGMAVTVSGWKTIPQAGDSIIEGSETDVKKALNNRVRKAEIDSSLSNVDAINESRRLDREQRLLDEKSAAHQTGRNNHFEEINSDSGKKELRLVIKADVSGSAEAVEGALQGIGNDIATSRIISAGVGDVTESDVMLAKAANAAVVAFSVSVPRSVQSIAIQNQVPIITSAIIYKLMDDVRERVRGLLPVIVETRVTGEAGVLQLFDITLKGKAIKKVAGCRVTNGLVEKSKNARVVRGGQIIHEGSLDTLKQLKKDATEVRKGTECGLSFDGFEDIHEGDVIQMFERIEKPGIL